MGLPGSNEQRGLLPVLTNAGSSQCDRVQDQRSCVASVSLHYCCVFNLLQLSAYAVQLYLRLLVRFHHSLLVQALLQLSQCVSGRPAPLEFRAEAKASLC